MPKRTHFWDPWRDPYNPNPKTDEEKPESEESKLLKRLEKLADETADFVSDKPKKGKK
jgi:hypothetical protein